MLTVALLFEHAQKYLMVQIKYFKDDKSSKGNYEMTKMQKLA